MKRTTPLERRGRRAGVGELPHINLLPEAAQARLAMHRQARVWAIGLACSGAAVAIAAFGVAATGARGAHLKSQVAAQREQIRMEETAARQLTAEAERLIRERESLIAGRARQSAAVLLRAVAGAVPDDVVLQSLDVVPRPTEKAGEKKPQSGQELKLAGLAAQYQAIGEIQERLRESGLYRDVTLVRAEAGRGSTAFYDFSIACRR